MPGTLPDPSYDHRGHSHRWEKPVPHAFSRTPVRLHCGPSLGRCGRSFGPLSSLFDGGSPRRVSQCHSNGGRTCRLRHCLRPFLPLSSKKTLRHFLCLALLPVFWSPCLGTCPVLDEHFRFLPSLHPRNDHHHDRDPRHLRHSFPASSHPPHRCRNAESPIHFQIIREKEPCCEQGSFSVFIFILFFGIEDKFRKRLHGGKQPEIRSPV